MAGIGISLNKILNHYSLTRTLAAYTVAGIVGGGPWLISVFGIILLAMLITMAPGHLDAIYQFRITIAYLIATSIIMSGPVGNSFARYIADQLFLNRKSAVIANLNGMLCIMTCLSGLIAFLCTLFFFPEQDLAYRFLFIGNFVVLTNIWVVINLLTALKDYRIILMGFLASYLLIIGLAYALRNHGLNAYLLSFLLGQTLLLLIFLMVIYREYPTNSLIEFHFLRKNKMYKILMLSGLLFSLGIWVDKFIFWYNPTTSTPGFGPLRASIIYDLPIFLAYIFSLPGTAAFLLLIETSFADYFRKFNDAIREGKPLSYINVAGNQVRNSAYHVISTIVKIQVITIILVFLFGEKFLEFIQVSSTRSTLLFIAVIGTSLQVLLLAIADILYYMDKKRDVCILSLLFVILNLIFTFCSIALGPFFYGFGFTGSLAVVCFVGIHFVNKEFVELEYKIIMFRETK